MNESEMFNRILDRYAREKAKQNYESNTRGIMMTDISLNKDMFTARNFHVAFEKDCINLLYEGIIIRQWRPTNVSVLYLYFEEETKLRLHHRDINTLIEYFEDLAQ